jgi:hypothetical protein
VYQQERVLLLRRLRSAAVMVRQTTESVMSYARSMTVDQPGCLIFLIDQSASMGDPFPQEQLDGAIRSKAVWLAHVLNEFLSELVLENTSGRRVRNRLDLAVIGYGGPRVGSVLPITAADGFATLQQLADHPLRVETQLQEYVDEDGLVLPIETTRKIWIEPVFSGATPMCEVLTLTKQMVTDWVQRHPQSYPPIVIHVTDGLSSDGDPIEIADGLRRLTTDDGAVLLYNCHITDQQATAVRWPAAIEQLVPKRSAHTLFEMSSELPPRAREQLSRRSGEELAPTARGYIYNANPAALRSMFEFGTVVTRLVADPQR